MRRIRLISSLALATALATAAAGAGAQTLSLNWNPRSGDVWVDSQLADINRYGSSYREPFIDEMVRYHGAPRDLVTDLLVSRRWAPGDVYYACAIAQIINRPCRYVADDWQAHGGQGWGAVAKRLGIKPGSPEFHRLKRGFVPTYDRWSRPIVLDVELQRAYPDRGRGHGKKHGKAHRDDHHDRGHGRGNGHKGKGNDGKGKEKGRGHH